MFYEYVRSPSLNYFFPLVHVLSVCSFFIVWLFQKSYYVDFHSPLYYCVLIIYFLYFLLRSIYVRYYSRVLFALDSDQGTSFAQHVHFHAMVYIVLIALIL
jgi:hypothetical protein